MNYYVIIPAYKPGRELIGLVSEVSDLGYTVVTVDDGGGEEYAGIFNSLDSRAVVLHHRVNRGKGAGLKTALAYIKSVCAPGDLIATMDADGQHLPADMQRVMMLAEENPGKLCLGVRKIDENMPKKSKFGNTVTRTTFAILTGTKVSDTQTGLRAFSADLIDDMLKIKGTKYEYEMNVLAFYGSRKHCICETAIQVIYCDKDNSSTHFRPFWDSFRVYYHLLKSVLKYSASAIISFLVDYGMLWLLLWLLGDSLALVANVGARMVSAPLNYILNCVWAFEKKITAKSALGYALLCLFTIAVDTGVLYLWELTGMPPIIAKLPTEVCMFIFNYFVQKKVVFKR